jgi:hypothetical protein
MLRRALNELFAYFITGLVIFYLGHMSGSQSNLWPLLLGVGLTVAYATNSALREFLQAAAEDRMLSLQNFVNDLVSETEFLQNDLPEEDEDE